MKFFTCLLLLALATNANAQNKVVVIPLGSDVSAQQFNDLTTQVNQQRVYGGVVNAFGINEGGGYFSSSFVSSGVYQIRVTPPLPTFYSGKPSIVVTSSDLARVANITSVDLELNHNQILYADFTVELRTTSLFLSNSRFSFQLKFAEFDTSVFSDQRLKTNIKAVGKTVNGFKLYQFNYKESADQQTFVGIMAQDLIATHPKAISIDNKGYYKVNYTMLGLKMATLEDWSELGMESVELDFSTVAKLPERLQNHLILLIREE